MKHDVLSIIAKKSPHLSWVKDRTIFLTLHGSRAYGTNVEGSDHDYRGVCIPSKEYFYSYHKKFEQAMLQDPQPDPTIFSLQKFFHLAANCNPNALEILYTEPEDHFIFSKLGEKLLANRDLFLSRRIKHTMCGYAYSQFKKIERHRDWILHPVEKPPTRKEFGLPEEPEISKTQYEAATADIQRELQRYNFDFLEDCPEATRIAVRNSFEEMLVHLKLSTEDQWMSAARTVGLNDNFIALMKLERAYRNKLADHKKYLNWKKTRNPERHAMEEKFGYDGKFALHLVRLTLMCKEVMLTGKVRVKRTDDRELLLSIRNGAWRFDQLKDYFENIEKELTNLYNKCTILPYNPDVNKIDKLCIELTESSWT